MRACGNSANAERRRPSRARRGTPTMRGTHTRHGGADGRPVDRHHHRLLRQDRDLRQHEEPCRCGTFITWPLHARRRVARSCRAPVRISMPLLYAPNGRSMPQSTSPPSTGSENAPWNCAPPGGIGRTMRKPCPVGDARRRLDPSRRSMPPAKPFGIGTMMPSVPPTYGAHELFETSNLPLTARYSSSMLRRQAEREQHAREDEQRHARAAVGDRLERHRVR